MDSRKEEIVSSIMNTKSERDINIQKAAFEKDKGNSYFKNGRYKEAIEHYTAGIHCDPSEPTLLCNRAMAYLKLKDYNKAKRDCDAAISLDPTYVKAFYRLALACLGLDDTDGARQNFQRVLDLEPSNRLASDELKKLKLKEVASSTVESANGKAEKVDLLVQPVQNPPAAWRQQPLTRITHIEEIRSVPVNSNGVNSRGDAENEVLPSEKQFELPPVPSTSVEFFSRWRSIIRTNKRAFGKYFLSIPTDSYSALFDRLIDSDILADIITALHNTIHSSNGDISTVISMSERLLKLSQLERFQVAFAFLDEPQKQVVKDIISRLINVDKSGTRDDQTVMGLIAELKTTFDT